jgi:hypothetical protein
VGRGSVYRSGGATSFIVRRGFSILNGWLESHKGTFSLVPLRAAVIALPRYHININSAEMVERLIHGKSVLNVPGDHSNLDHYLWISLGLLPD